MVRGSQGIETIDTQPWWEVGACPRDCICIEHGTDVGRIGRLVGEFRKSQAVEFWEHSVFVLECKSPSKKDVERAVLVGEQLHEIPPFFSDATIAERAIYVGRSTRIVDYLEQAVYGDGPSFLSVFPPVRILDITWYPSREQAHDEKRWAGDVLEDRFDGDPEVYVFYHSARF